MTRILIPTDFSENSWTALRCAAHVFGKRPATFILFHAEELPVIDTTYPAEAGDIVIHKNISSYQKLLQLKERALEEIPDRIHIETIHKTGPFIKCIKEAIEKASINLIVMSTKGANVFNTKELGSTTRDVITRVRMNTLIVPQEVRCSTPTDIAFLTDYNLIFKDKTITDIGQIIAPSKAHLSIVHLAHENDLTPLQERNKQVLDQGLATANRTFHFMLNQTLDEALQFFINVHSVGLIILLAKNLNYAQNLFFTSHDQSEFNYHATTPFLILHDTDTYHSLG